MFIWFYEFLGVKYKYIKIVFKILLLIYEILCSSFGGFVFIFCLLLNLILYLKKLMELEYF